MNGDSMHIVSLACDRTGGGSGPCRSVLILAAGEENWRRRGNPTPGKFQNTLENGRLGLPSTKESGAPVFSSTGTGGGGCLRAYLGLFGLRRRRCRPSAAAVEKPVRKVSAKV